MIRADLPAADAISTQNRDALIEQMTHDVMLQLCDGVDMLAARYDVPALTVWRMQHETLRRVAKQVTVRLWRLEAGGR